MHAGQDLRGIDLFAEQALTAPSSGVAGLHLFTFNQIAETERWRRAWLERLGG